nr:PREDICTED: nephrocystin-4 [Latimeria chalumnae]|eukprot:XP_014348387.1 PREDICTED: nephrocystin-4 [Latimeria chalumnae]
MSDSHVFVSPPAVYFYTSLTHPNVVAVLEVVTLSQKKDGTLQALSCGFGVIRFFHRQSPPSDSVDSAPDKRLNLYHGTPRALLHPELLDPFEPDALRNPQLLKTFKCSLDKLSISLYPSLEKFEDELVQLLNTDRLRKNDSSPDGNVVTIQERRLHVGVHNGWGFVQKPQVAVLVPEAEVTKGRTGSFNRKSGSPLKTSLKETLVHRSRLQLNEVVNHPAFALVFRLEYVFSAPIGVDGKMSSTASLAKAAYMHTIRWVAWNPITGSGSTEVTLPLQGGPLPNPSNVLVYKSPSSEMSSPEVQQVESGVVHFRFSSRLDRPSSPALPAAGETQRLRKSRSPSPRGTSKLVTTQGSPQGPGLSVSQLAASPRYPTIGHSTAGQWQQKFPCQLFPSPMASSYQSSHAEVPLASCITHLEADLLDTIDISMTSRLTRATLAQLYSSGFPEILDCNNEPAEVRNPADPVNFNPQREEADFLQSNEIILQFLAFSRVHQEGLLEEWPKAVYFTFQFYRFPPVTTERLILLNSEKSRAKAGDSAPCILVHANKDGSINIGDPGLQLKYMVDPSFLKAGEQRWFVRYLAIQTMQIDIWDAESLLLIGSAAVELKHLLRQGQTAVQVSHELEVITTEYTQDLMALSGDVTKQGTIKPIGVSTIAKGRLHLRLGNVGHLSDQRLKEPASLPPPRSRIVAPHDGTSGFKGGSLSSYNVYTFSAVKKAARAQRLADVDSELAAVLFSRMKEANSVLLHTNREADTIRRRKVERMMAVRHYESQENTSSEKPHILARHTERIQHARDLQIIESYRERIKSESIASMLGQAITTNYTVYATLGTAEFFEFALKNPYNVQQTVTITSGDPELSVIVDAREWRYFKELTNTLTPLEEDMFHLQGNELRPQLYLRPKEVIHIPFKYQSFTADHTVIAQGPADMRLGKKTNVVQHHQPNTVVSKRIKVSFNAEDEKPVAILQVSVESQPHVIDQTFRFYHPELTFLKKSIRLPPWHALPGASVGLSNGELEIYARCSDPNIICETKRMGLGEPQDIFLKVPGGRSPNVKKFFVTIYTDPWLAVPIQIWQFYIHALQRVDISCVTGQLTQVSLVLRGTQAVRKVKGYTSHPHELQVDPAGVFVLPPNAVQDLHLSVRPQKAGSKFIYLNVVDVDYCQLVASWLVCVSSRQPLISKAFEITLPVRGGKGSNKRITYTNPYPTRRAYFLRTNRPDLLQFKEDSFEISGAETYTIGLRFAPSQNTGMEEILIYINDQEDKNEETFCVKVIYQ